MDIIAPQSTAIEPEVFQATLIEFITKTLLRENSPPCLLRAPTGSGKTFVIAKVLQNVTEASPTIWFWFVPFVNLVQQTEDVIAGNATTLVPISMSVGRNQEPASGQVIISTAQSVGKAKSRIDGYADGTDDFTRSLDGLVALARAKNLKIGLVVDEAHIGLDNQTEFGQFAHWLQADRLIMATATPKDQRLSDFIAKAGYSGFETFSVSRDEVVNAHLNKRYIEAVVYMPRESMSSIVDLQTTVLVQAWKRNQKLKGQLVALGNPVVPLLLVQVANGADSVIEAKKQLMSICGIHPALIGEHSSDFPDPVLMASIANDSTKEVLIFKQSAGTGFDAPRAFVLASTKPVNDPDFALQFIGRIMRVHRAIRSQFPNTKAVPPDLDTAYVYLANSEAQQGFEQAVAVTTSLKTNLEGQSEKLIARKMASGHVVYSNRQTNTPPLIYSTPYVAPPAASCSDAEKSREETTAKDDPIRSIPVGENFGLPGVLSAADAGLDEMVQEEPHQKNSAQEATPTTKDDFFGALPAIGIRAYKRRIGLAGLPICLISEKRPELNNMAEISRAAASRLTITKTVEKWAVDVALGRAKDKEIRTEITKGAKSEQSVALVLNRVSLANQARQALDALPQVEDEDTKIIIDVITKRMRPSIVEAVDGKDLPESDIDRMARDAAYDVIRKERDALEELFHAEISTKAETTNAGPLPDAMLYALDIGLEASSKNLYGILPPSKEDISRLQDVLTIDDRELLAERTLSFEDGDALVAPFDGAHSLGRDERSFSRALDAAEFVQWWHRNPHGKSYSMRLVRGEHKHYFYPDFVVCLEHFPGDEPLLRLIETKESIKDAVRKAKHTFPYYGRVLFLTADKSKWRVIQENGTLGDPIDLDYLTDMQDMLRGTRPIVGSSST